MICKDCEEQISAYMDNELGHQEKILIESHLVKCESCRHFWKDIIKMERDLHKAMTRCQPSIRLVSTIVDKICSNNHQ